MMTMRRRSAGVVAAAMLVTLAIWALARMLDVELTVGKGLDARPVGAADGPTWLADGAAGVVLIGMHLAVGVVLIAGFGRQAATTD